ncbi:MAG TPA: FAD/NAD(P)-binding oxidoreductase [Rhodanobacteraceae bacterium]|jgi:NADPH-dependent 2,4-dienoyl-CoA reductase/sulfur reductase-like enzyme|nr:FAD/NAD(P)-binding oxidoreductase [Rhodanobacteraceae bacterium]
MTERRDVLVVGAGPAGLAAAAAAAAHGANVTMLDAQKHPGGQVWRHDIAHRAPRRARRALRRIASVRWCYGMRVVDADISARSLRAEDALHAREFRWDRLVLATGARELFLPFPGWTLPGVTGAGGLQALVKQGWPVDGGRVVVAGSGPLLLAAAATLRAHGARVMAIVEQAARKDVHAFARGLWRWPDKLAQAVALRAKLAGVPFHYDAVVRRALGDEHLRAVEIDHGGAIARIECDQLAAGFGLVPEIGLARLLGCALTDAKHPAVRVDALQRTNVEGVFAAGEACGIGGMQTASIEGAIAGHAAAGGEEAARRLIASRDHARHFAATAARTFSPGSRTHALADDSTIACRCEDVTVGELRAFDDARSAKLATRCGMGACQGRICGAALAELMGWTWHGHARQPLFPARLATLGLHEPSIAIRSNP